MITRRALLGCAAIAGLRPSLAGARSTPSVSDSQDVPRSTTGVHTFAPTFSKAERDRRWAAVRAVMSRPPWDLAAILVPVMSDQAYTRYLSQIGGATGGADLIFPRESTKPTLALVGSGRNAEQWNQLLKSWTADGQLVVSDKGGVKAVVDGLKALGLAPGARIGVAKLTGTRFEGDGLVSVTYLKQLESALPGVAFVGIEQWGVDAGPVDGPAMVKGREEQDVVRASAAAAEKGLHTLTTAIRSARIQADAWHETFHQMFLDTGEEPTRLSISFDQPANTTLGVPTPDPVKDGLIVSQEIDATVQGYRAQVNHSFFVGGPGTKGYDYYAAAMNVCVEVFQDAVAFIVPGKTTCGQLVERYASVVAKSNAEDESGVVLHSSGIANLSRPRLGATNSREDHPIVLRPGMTFDFKPALRLKRGYKQDVGPENRVLQLGDHVLVTETGAVRIGRRPLGPLVTRPA
jgi:Xaa-Pro aminopeptidase